MSGRRKLSSINALRNTGRMLGFLYFLSVFFLVFIVWRPQLAGLTDVERIDLLPGKNLFHFFAQSTHTVKDYYYFYAEVVGNVLMFIPLPFFLWFLFNVKNSRKLILIALLTSLVIELCQYVFEIGIADINDVLENTLGAVITVGILTTFRDNKQKKSKAENAT